MSHDELKALVADLAIGALDAAEARRVEAHAASCPECAAELRSLTGAAGLFRALPDLPAPPAGEASLLDGAGRAADRMAAARRPARRMPRWLLGLALGGAGAAALLVAVQLGRAPASRLDEGRGALEGPGAPVPVAAAPRAGAPMAEGDAAPRSDAAKATAPTSPALATAPPAADDALGEARTRAAAAIGAAAEPAAPAATPHETRLAEQAPAAEAPAAKRKEVPVAGPGEPPAARAADATAGTLAKGKGEAAAAASARSGAAAPPPERRTFAGCAGEATRTLWRDASGRVTRRERQGRLGGQSYRVVESFDEAGRLSGARLEAGGRSVVVDRAGLDEGRLAGLVPGLDLAPDAAAAVAEPPRCAP